MFKTIFSFFFETKTSSISNAFENSIEIAYDEKIKSFLAFDWDIRFPISGEQFACEKFKRIIDGKLLSGSRVYGNDSELLELLDSGLVVLCRAYHRFYPVWAMALMTGMRSGELFALKWTDIDFDGRTISVSKSWNSKIGITPTKTRRNRTVPVSDDLARFLKEIKLKDGTEEFVLPRLREWEHGDQARVTRDFCEGLGITSVKFHDLRATFITNLLARGESLARVMSIVGHSELKTTNGYLRKAGVDVQGGTDKLGYKLPNESEAEVLSIVGRIKSQF